MIILKGDRKEVLEKLEELCEELSAMIDTKANIAVDCLSEGNAVDAFEYLRESCGWRSRARFVCHLIDEVRKQPYEDAGWAQREMKWHSLDVPLEPKEGWSSYDAMTDAVVELVVRAIEDHREVGEEPRGKHLRNLLGQRDQKTERPVLYGVSSFGFRSVEGQKVADPSPYAENSLFKALKESFGSGHK